MKIYFILFFDKDRKLLGIGLNGSTKWRLKKLSTTIYRPSNCAELLHFTIRRTTLCECSDFLGNYKTDKRKYTDNADSFFHLHSLISVSVSVLFRHRAASAGSGTRATCQGNRYGFHFYAV